MSIKGIFRENNENRLRTGWRLLLQFVLLLLMTGLLSLVILPVAKLRGGDEKITILQIAPFLATLLSVYLARRFLDKRSFTSLGLHSDGAVRDLLFGFALGGTVMLFLFGVEWAAGWLKSPEWRGGEGGMIVAVSVTLAYYVMIGVQEELLARGYWLQNLAESMNIGWAVALSSLIFAIGHLGNEGFNALAVLSLLAAGVLLAFGWVRSGQLWLPIGLHIGWNFFESALGFPVSGLESFHLVRHVVNGPEILVGGAFGPESGLLSFVAMGLAALGIYLWTKRQKSA